MDIPNISRLMSGRKAVYPEVNINRFNHAYTSENERFITGYILFPFGPFRVVQAESYLTFWTDVAGRWCLANFLLSGRNIKL